MSTKYVALLRGINVGGKNKLPMKELAELFDKAKCTDVVTYIQSGNVVFNAPKAVAAKLPETLAAAIEKRHGLRVPVVLRTAEDLARVASKKPFPKADPSKLHVVFLADAPDKETAAALDPNRSPGDEFVLDGGEIYFHLPNGVADTKFTNQYLDSRLKTVSTGRNWKTVQRLAELAGK